MSHAKAGLTTGIAGGFKPIKEQGIFTILCSFALLFYLFDITCAGRPFYANL